MGDAGPGAVDYADLVAVELVDLGDRLEAAIQVHGDIPRALGSREVAGVGLDLYVTEGTESDYQVFLEGSEEGWFAYLETPRGSVRYPGTFTLAGDRFVVTLPWGALDGQRSGRLSVFADHSSALLALAVSSEDHLPDRVRAAFG